MFQGRRIGLQNRLARFDSSGARLHARVVQWRAENPKGESPMTPEQFYRWKDFALRMARCCFRKRRRPNARWIEEVAQDFFDGFDPLDVCCIVNWDNSTPYPEGHPRRRVERMSPSGPRWEGPYCVGDMMSDLFDPYRGYSPNCEFCTELYDRTARTCTVSELNECRCEDIEDRYYEQWDEQWASPVHCCIRAGLDFASAPSAGVIGFTAGDIRRMYPEGVPDWVFPPGEQLQYWLSDELDGTFAELPDSAVVVL